MNLKKQVGPLPVWAWGGAIGLGILIYYWRKNSSGAQVATSNVAANPVLDPTQGAFDMPSGLSSGGTVPDVSSSYTPSDFADAVTQQLTPILASLPYASAPGEPQTPTTGADAVTQVTGIIKDLKDAGLIQTLPAASTGAAVSQAQSHKAATPPAKRVNTSARNPRKGQTYRVVNNPHGKPKGIYHVYGTGKKAQYIKVRH